MASGAIRREFEVNEAIRAMHRSFDAMELKTSENYSDILTNLNAFVDQITISATWQDDLNIIANYSYAGFKPREMIEAMITKAISAIPARNFVRDVQFLLMLFFTRGPNLTNIKKKSALNEDQQADFKRMIDVYGLKTNASGAIEPTLPRLSAACCYFAWRIASKLETRVNRVVSDGEMGAVASVDWIGNYTPGLIDIGDSPTANQKNVYLINNIYQARLTVKTSSSKNVGGVLVPKKSLGESMRLAVFYAKIASNQSVETTTGKEAFKNIMAVSYATFEKILLKFIRDLKPEDWEKLKELDGGLNSHLTLALGKQEGELDAAFVARLYEREQVQEM